MTDVFTLSAFSDEISPDMKEQLYYLNQFGIKYFEIRGVNEKNIADLTLDEARKVKSLADGYGIQVSSIGSPIGKIKITDPFEPHMELLAHIISLAKLFETDYIRVFSFFIPQGEDPAKYKDEVIRRMKAMTALAEKEDMILLHENEKEIYGDTAPRCKEILDAIGSPNLRAVFDPANFVECGQETYPAAYELLKDDVVYIHIKDALAHGKIVPAGMGNGHVEELLRAFEQKGYRGFLSIEPHLGQFDGLSALQSDTSVVNEDRSGPDTFKIAYDALVKILNKI